MTPETKEKNKCGGCKWLDLREETCIGYPCRNPDRRWRTKTAQFHYKHTTACKMYEESDGSNLSTRQEVAEAKGSERKQDTDSSNLRSQGRIQIKLEKRTPEEKQAYMEGYEAGKKKKQSLTDIIDERLEEVKAEICDKICKYPDNWDEETQGQLCESEQCSNCPLNRL